MLVLGFLFAAVLVAFTLNYSQESVNALIQTHQRELETRDVADAQNVLAMLDQIQLLREGKTDAAIASLEDRLYWELRRLRSWKPEGESRSGEVSEASQRGSEYEAETRWSPEQYGHRPTSLRFFAAARPQYVNGKVIGVEVDQVLSESWLAQLGVEDGDVIVLLDGAPIRSLGAAEEVTTKLSGTTAVAMAFLKPDGLVQHVEYSPHPNSRE